MKTIILCGGKGSRMREETEYRPKPMVEIGGKPILWHIMKIYAHHGHNEFILPLGYKGDMIKRYFLHDARHTSDFTYDPKENTLTNHTDDADHFRITFVDTGLESLTGERLLRCRHHLGDEAFMATYGDGVGDIPITDILAFHRKQGTIGTITGSHPRSKWGLVSINPRTRLAGGFIEKPALRDYVNSGFMVFTKKIFDYLDKGTLEAALARLAADRQLSVYTHDGFWKAMDTYQEMEELNKLWEKDRPWAVWEDSHKA
jgi:glucose-1-phosphate cytidylyltransferase